jgi:hypothetical protein
MYFLYHTNPAVVNYWINAFVYAAMLSPWQEVHNEKGVSCRKNGINLLNQAK